jgi:hypothetical protein
MQLNYEYTPEMLDKIKECGGLFLSVRETGVILNLDPVKFLEDMEYSSGMPYMAYFTGKTLSKYELRQKTIALAKMGSPPAQVLAEKYIIDQQTQEYE